MIKHFLLHQWRSGRRSTIWQKNLLMNIFIGFIIFIMFSYLLVFGLLIDKILQELAPGEDHVVLINGFLLYYFSLDLLFRFLMQNLPVLSIESYLHLPVRKKHLLHFMVGRTAFNVLNFLPLLVFIPAAIKVVALQYGDTDAWVWISAMVFIIFANSFFATYLKRQMGSKPAVVAITGGLIALLIVLDFFNVFSLSDVSAFLFGLLFRYSYLLLLVFAWLIVAYAIHYHFLKKRLYPEEIEKRKSKNLDRISEIQYLKSLGITGSIIALEMRLFWRNKRTRTILFMFPLFLLYGLFFYPNPEYKDQNGFLIFVGIFMTGGLMINYVNYAFAYESGYFDALLTKNIDFSRYIKVKYIIGLLMCTICYILTIPYIFFGTNIFFINTMTFIYNIGVLSIVMLYLATYNKKRMDLTRGGTFNYQGLGASNWLAMLPAFLMPVLIYAPFGIAGYRDAGLMFIGILGLIGLSLYRYFLGLVAKNFYKRKYHMAVGFRQRN